MRNTMRHFMTLSTLVVAGAVVHAPVAAQATTRMLSAPNPTVEQLEAHAYQVEQSPREWLATASALEQAAKLRAANDPTGVDDLLVAAQAYYAAHRYVDARDALRMAGDRAEAMGADDQAGRAYLGALRISLQLHEDDVASHYLAVLKKLGQSGRMSSAARQEILGPLATELCPCR